MVWVKRAGVAIVVILIIVAVAAWFLAKSSLPKLDGSLDVGGLEQLATIERDELGVATITAADRRDLAFATGYAHGQDRFFQMDLIRRDAAGELSALIGAVTLDTDKRRRFHRFRARADAVLATLPDTDLALLQAYADGVNEGVNGLDAWPFEYWLLGTIPEPWQPSDTLLALYSMYMTLNDPRARRDVRRGYSKSGLPEEVYEWLYPQGTPWDAPIEGEAREPLPIPDESVFPLKERTLPEHEGPVDPPVSIMPGSNNWVVSGELTDTGVPMVSNDMHLGITVPNIWYRARLVTTDDDGVDISGVTLPGAPFIVAGSNGHIAWGFTNSYGDWSDAVIVSEAPGGEGYLTSDGVEPYRVYDEVIEVKDAESVTMQVRETRWGPVDDQVDFQGKPVAVSWIAHHPEGVNINVIGLERVKTLAEAQAVANTMGIPPQNFVAADAQGNIGWTIAGRIPVRGDFDPMVPTDWSAAEGWTGWRPPSEYPRVINPESGRIWTANARVVDGDNLAIIGDGGYDLGARAKQIRDGLFDKDRFSAEDMLDIQRDSRALFLTPWRDLAVRVLEEGDIAGEPDLVTYLELVRDWIPEASPDSVGYRLVRAFRLRTRQLVFDSLIADVQAQMGEQKQAYRSSQFESALWQIVTEQPRHLLPDEFSDWDSFLVDTLRRIAADYQQNYDGGLEQRTWGEFNAARISHPLSQAIPALSGWLDMPSDPLYGDANLPLAQSSTFGASERFSVSPGAEERGIMHMPTGQSGHPMSDFYRKGHEDWVSGTPSPFLPGETLHRLELLPN